jgi:hypothetical protein
MRAHQAPCPANGLTRFETSENVEQKQCSVSESVSTIAAAAAWLAANPDEVVQPVIPFVRTRFGLGPVEAIAALKVAHALRHGGA